jgi:pyrimidine deaminase RibD-like protein
LGKGRSDHRDEAVVHCLKNAGVQATPLSEWVVTWNPTLRDRLKNATLYLTLEPSPERRGQACPPLTQLIAQAGVTRVVIGTTHPVTPTQGAYAMHQAGLEVVLLQNDEDCHQLVEPYAELTKTKMQRIARIHFQRTGRVSIMMLTAFRRSRKKLVF